MPSFLIRPFLGAALAAAVTAAPAWAQFGNPAGMLPGTVESQPGVPASGQPNVQDRLFIHLMGMGNTGEVALSRLADRRATHDAVKAHARQMQRDHADAGSRLAAVAKPLGIGVPKEPDPDQKAAQARLEGLKGTAFDAAYLQNQLIDHQKTVLLLTWEISNGQEASVQAFAKETLPTVMGHLQHVQTLLAEVTAAGPQGLGRTTPPAEKPAR